MSVREKPRPPTLRAVTTKCLTDHGNMYVTITYKRAKKPFEVFVALGHTDPCERAWIEATSRAISTGLRYGVPVSEFIKQLSGISCVPVPNGNGGFTLSPADAMAGVLRKFVEG